MLRNDSLHWHRLAEACAEPACLSMVSLQVMNTGSIGRNYWVFLELAVFLGVVFHKL